MNTEEAVDLKVTLKQISAKLALLRNFLIVADEGVRQQQSAANDEIISVLRDISSQLSRVLRQIEK